MAGLSISKQEARNYLVNRSFLNQKAQNIEEALEYLSCIQVDPINVVAKSHELALFNRVEGFTKQSLQNAIYEERKFYEHWLQLFSIIPMKYFPHLRVVTHADRGWLNNFYAENKRVMDQVLDFVRENGPTTSKDITHMPTLGPIYSWFGKETHSSLLTFLWDRGDLLISGRKGNNRIYDLTERVVPPSIFNAKVDEMEAKRFVLSTHFKYLGLVQTTNLTKFGYIRALGLKQLLRELVEAGEIVEVDVEGAKTKYYLLKSQLTEFEKLSRESLHERLNILPPLDPLVIDRRLLREIFDYDYKWEVYVPKHLRKFGYYSMPLLYRGGIVGKVELQKTKTGGLKVLRKQLLDDSKQVTSTLKDAVKELGEWVRNSV